MEKNNKKKAIQLGMPLGTAAGKLRKTVMFDLLKQLGKDVCFRCGKKIELIENLSIEHKIPWLDSKDPIKLFFDLDNIAFSHTKCNYSDARRPNKIEVPDGHFYCTKCKTIKTVSEMNKGCLRKNGYRCKECHRNRMKQYRIDTSDDRKRQARDGKYSW